jgi:hypothetical protein
MKAYCINLKTSTDRRKKMTDQFEREGLDVEFVEGYNSREEKPVLENSIYIGDFGNLMSIRKVLSDMVEHNIDQAVIFEDTVKLCSNFKTKLEQLVLPDRWDLVYLGYLTPVCWSEYSDQLNRGKVLGTWSFMVTLECAKKLLAFDPLDFWISNDVHLTAMPLRTFYTKEKLTVRDKSIQTIGGANFITRQSLRPLFLCHVLQWFPILEILFLILVLILYIRLRR